MTVASEKNTSRHTGDGTTVSFPITFSFAESTHVKVFVDGVSTTSGFSVIGGDPTGTLTFDTAPSSGADVFFRRVVPIVQDKDYPTNDTFPSASHEAALDTLTYIAQQLQRDIDLTLSFPESLDITDASLPEPEDDKILAWDGTTGAVKNGPTIASFEAATNTAVSAAATATTQAGIATGAASTATTQAGLAEDSADYAAEWANKAEDSLVSAAAGGDEIDDYSAKHWANKAAASAVSADIGNINALTAGTVVAADELAFADVNDSNTVKKDTVADLVAAGLAGAGTDLSVNNNKITDVTDPTAAQDVATKNYVDTNLPESGLVLLGSYTASNVTSVDIGSGLDLDAAIDGTYDEYLVKIYDVQAQSGSRDILLRTSSNGGVSFDSGGSDYNHIHRYVSSGSGSGWLGAGAGSDSSMTINGDSVTSASDDGADFTIHVFRPSNAARNTSFEWSGNVVNGSNMWRQVGGGARFSAGIVNALRFFMSSGNINGRFYLYGIKKT